MTNIKVIKKNGKIITIEAKGHACYADFGTDIVCASISSILGACHLGLVKVAKVKIKHFQKQGEFKFEVFENNEKSDAILNTCLLALAELAENYSKNLKLDLIGE